jgi:pSer/pThr/pTyr-binding forkhead associated (FHA) protein
MKGSFVCPRCRATNVGPQNFCLLCWAPMAGAAGVQGKAPPDDAAARRDPYTGRAKAAPAARLALVRGAGPVQVNVPAGGLTIGRNPTEGLVLGSDSLVSRQHARLEYAGGQWILTDVGSRNGTFVNGARVTRQALRPGDQIQIGQCTWVFQTA